MGELTVIMVTNPSSVGKTYYMHDGKLTKQAVADVWDGAGRVLDVPDATGMARLLAKVTASNNLVLVNGVFRGVGDESFGVTTAARFERRILAEGGDPKAVRAAGKAYTLKTGRDAGRKLVARLKDLQAPSGWLLLDADEPEGFPDAWRPLTFQQRLELLEPIAPGISLAERVELRGSSARVVRKGERPKPASHAWVRVDDPEDVARAAIALGVHAVAAGIYFDSPRYSRTTGEVIGASARTAIDLAPWHRGRLNFDSAPTVTAEGYEVADAGITIVNRGGGPFRPGGVAEVTPVVTRTYREKTGHAISVSARATSAMAAVYGQLTLGTIIEASGVSRTLAAWLAHMDEHGLSKMRCEAPFRASSSEAAFIGFSGDGSPFVYDIGVATTYRLAPDFDDDIEATGEGQGDDDGPPGDALGRSGDGDDDLPDVADADELPGTTDDDDDGNPDAVAEDDPYNADDDDEAGDDDLAHLDDNDDEAGLDAVEEL